MRLALLLLALPLHACGSDDDPRAKPPVDDAGVDAAPDASDGAVEADAPQPACGSAKSELPSGLTELSYDDGIAGGDIRHGTAAITVDGQTYALAEVALREAMRFELEHPAKIHGFRVQWANLAADADPATEIEAGLYPDFGYNGFDYWEKDPLWTGTRCAGDVAAGEWSTYAFDAPITIEEPGLVYVAHAAPTPDMPVFAYDESAAASCEKFDDCRAAFNLPEAPGYYDGVSFPFQRDFLVRLVVEYTDNVAPADKIFQQVSSTSGQHVSWGDYDHDGWDDLLVGGALFRNDQGSFVDVTQSSGIAAAGIAATGGVWGDYDNDGCLDVFLFSESPAAGDGLLRSNCDGTFSDVTAASLIGDLQSYEDCGQPGVNVHAPTASAAWVDLDADGFVDLYHANFICWDKETYYVDQVFRNKGDGTFEEWTGAHGFSNKKTASRVVAPADADGDGDMDVFVGNYRLQQNLHFQNEGAGQFTETGFASGLAGVQTVIGLGVYFGHTIGAAWGDLDGDADLDLVAANLAHPRFFNFSNKTQILLNQGNGIWTDNAGTWVTPFAGAGLRYQETHSVPVLADHDLDGALDLSITCVYDGRPMDFYWGKGDGSFELDAYHAGLTTENGWGAAAADFDNDGDPDLFATKLFENTLGTSAKGHFLQVRVIGNAGSNRAALGARVLAKAGAKQLLAQVSGGNGKGGQDSQTLVFGLGAATGVDEIVVTFPGGKAVTFAGPFTADQRVWLFEDGTHAAGMSPP